VIAALNTPARRIILAFAVSVLLHAAVLWLPYIHWPHAKVELPPLNVRLEHLPKPAEQPAEKTEPANPISKTVTGTSGKTTSGAMNKMDKTEEQATAHPFPKHLRLTFVVHKSADGFMTGEIHHQLDIRNDRYTLKSVRQTAGLTSLRNSDRLIQASHGRIGEHGLQPETFEEESIKDSGKQSRQATFDWAAQKMRFSHGDETTLPADAQDTLSFLYQLSQLPINGEFFPLPVSDGTQLKIYQIEIGAKEDIDTPMGKLRALHLRKMHTQGEAYFEIWLGLEYRLLPVKFRQLDVSGNLTDEYVITDLRSSDE
jgi:hypothetical protein